MAVRLLALPVKQCRETEHLLESLSKGLPVETKPT
jgi:hypothetical protein